MRSLVVYARTAGPASDPSAEIGTAREGGQAAVARAAATKIASVSDVAADPF
jgi:hypothetical protein